MVVCAPNFRDSACEQKKLLEVRAFLDRRRLEEAFLLFASLEMVKEYNLVIGNIPYDKNELVKAVTGPFEKAFYAQWTGKFCIF